MLNNQLRFKLLPTVTFLILLPLLLMLAMWQFGRAGEKKLLLEIAERNTKVKITDLPGLVGLDVASIRYQQIELVGRYDPKHQFLLDNQIKSKKPGFMVLTPFFVDGSKYVLLVNRGWIPLGNHRSEIPDLSVTHAVISLRGRINTFPSVGIKLKDVEIPSPSWPSIVQVIDTNSVGKKLGRPIWPFQVELDSDQPFGYNRDWSLSKEMLPEQHVAYALQWLALAITLTVLYFWYSLKGGDAKTTE